MISSGAAGSAENRSSADVAFGDGRARFFVPPNRAPEARLPLVLLLHGLGGSGSAIAEDLGLDAFAERKGFIYVAPDGTLDSAGRRFWNAGATCCDFFGTRVDDVGRLHALVQHGVRALPVDASRVFVVGYSNGGFMAHRLACERSESLASIVSIAASGPSEACAARRSVSVLEIHGDSDPIVPFAGGPLFSRPGMPEVGAVARSLTPWLTRNGCSGEFRRRHRVDLVSDIAGTETDVLRPSQCAAAPVELWTVRGGSHYLRLEQASLDKVWDFLARMPADSPEK